MTACFIIILLLGEVQSVNVFGDLAIDLHKLSQVRVAKGAEHYNHVDHDPIRKVWVIMDVLTDIKHMLHYIPKKNTVNKCFSLLQLDLSFG